MFFLKHHLPLILALLVASNACSDPENDAPQSTPGADLGNNDPDVPVNDDAAGMDPESDAEDMLDVPEDRPDADDDEPDGEVPGDEDAGEVPDAGDGDPGGECDPFEQDCPDIDGEPQQCNPIQGVPNCVEQNPSQNGVDEACDGGDCAAGLTCITWSDGRGQICTQMCRPGDSTLCEEGKVCSAFIRSNPDIGICRPPRQACDIYAQDCPEEGFACTFGRDPENNEPIFVCEREGPNGQGDACAGGNGRCQAGMVCIRDDETTSTCHKICQEDDECDFGEQACAGRSTTWQVTFCR